MVPRDQEGPDDIENAIPVCFECHAEIHSYNDKHPRGRKFRSEELKKHKEQWLDICKNKAEVLVQAIRDADVGPLQALIDELEFNLVVADHFSSEDIGCLFLDDQFKRAIREGVIALLQDELKKAILEAYRMTGRENHRMVGAIRTEHPNQRAQRFNELTDSKSIDVTKSKIELARKALLRLLSSEPEETP